MTRKELIATATVALGTMAIALALGLPTFLNAADEKGPAQEIQTPKLEALGCTFTLKPEKADYKIGDSPVMTLDANNPTQERVEAKVIVAYMQDPNVSRMARMIPMPTQLFQKEITVTLEPGQTKSVSVATEKPLQDKTSTFFTLAVSDKAIRVAGFNHRLPADTGNLTLTNGAIYNGATKLALADKGAPPSTQPVASK